MIINLQEKNGISRMPSDHYSLVTSVGQDKVVDNLRIFVKAARLRAEALDHVLLHGPPGLGKQH